MSEVEELRAEVARLRAIIDRPDPTDFVNATIQEARYQLIYWGDNAWHDNEGWFWLLGYLGGKALREDGPEKRLHRVTAVAAACANWHCQLTGKIPWGTTDSGAPSGFPAAGVAAELEQAK